MPALLEKVDVTKQMADPFRWFDRMRDAFERLFETGAPRLPSLPRTGAPWMPAIEILEKNGAFCVYADLPGMKKEDVTLEVSPEGLTIKGERKAEMKEEREGYYRTERTYGGFCRFVPLPDGANIDKITALFKDGVLEIAVPVPKLEKANPRPVDIK